MLPSDLTGLGIAAASYDGWKVESVITLGWMDNDKYIYLSADYHVNKWLDLDDPLSARVLDFTLLGTVPPLNNGTRACTYMN